MNINGYATEYDWDFAVQRATTLSEELHSKGEKLCLFIGRRPGEPFPGFGQEKPDDETWVSLDLGKNDDPPGFLPGKQLHIQMDMNDERIQKIHKLFDKVIVDWSTLKFCRKPNEAWYSLGKLLRPQKESQLITETANYSLGDYYGTLKLFCQSETWKNGVDLFQDRKISFHELLQLWPEEEKPTWEYRDVCNTDLWKKAQEQWKNDRTNGILNMLKSDGFFSEVLLETTTLYPYAYHKFITIAPYFVLSGPTPALYERA